MRKLHEVLDKMLEKIPEGDLKFELQRVRKSSIFAAPEMNRFWWDEASRVFGLYFTKREIINPTDFHKLEDWECEIMSIWTGKTISKPSSGLTQGN